MKAVIRFVINALPYAAMGIWYMSWGQDLHWAAIAWLWFIVFLTDTLCYSTGFARSKYISMLLFKEMHEKGYISKAFFEQAEHEPKR